MRCPFCFADKEDRAPVCPTCNRDTAIPGLLVQERDDLVRKRDLFRDELAAKQARLAALGFRTKTKPDERGA